MSLTINKVGINYIIIKESFSGKYGRNNSVKEYKTRSKMIELKTDKSQKSSI